MLGPEFQLGADILATVIASILGDAQPLAVILVTRTVLSHFFQKELEQKREQASTAPEQDALFGQGDGSLLRCSECSEDLTAARGSSTIFLASQSPARGSAKRA